MKIEPKEITIREITDSYTDKDEEGVTGYGGKLDIRPKYQREFVYKDAKRDAVIETILSGFPLNVMYWAKNGDGFEVLDGQQRTISLCQFVTGKFSLTFADGIVRYFHNMSDDEKARILDYTLLVYVCEGADSEKLSWFRTINIAGEKLLEQELRNAVYTGTWLTDAKKYFSRKDCPAYNEASEYVSGSPIRQDYLETALSWISGDRIEHYMAEHQQDPNAAHLWAHFRSVITWAKSLFGHHYRSPMKSVNWGELYNRFKDRIYDSVVLEQDVARLMQDDDVTNKKGIYPYLFTRDEKWLSIRAFTGNQRIEAYTRQKGICPACERSGNETVHYAYSEMEADHITPWHGGGKTIAGNCQMLCKPHNRLKSGV